MMCVNQPSHFHFSIINVNFFSWVYFCRRHFFSISIAFTISGDHKLRNRYTYCNGNRFKVVLVNMLKEMGYWREYLDNLLSNFSKNEKEEFS